MTVPPPGRTTRNLNPLREEAGADDTTAAAPGAGARAGAGLVLPTPALVTFLQSLQGYPLVSLLLSTTPAPRMTALDAARLGALARDARRRWRARTCPACARR